MPLTCSCYDDGDADWYFDVPEDYSTLVTKRRQRCKSCGDLIEIGAVCLMFPRWRYPISDVEEKIFGEGDEIPLAEFYQCEKCADLFFSLHDLGFCVVPDEDMREIVRQYAEMVLLAKERKHARLSPSA